MGLSYVSLFADFVAVSATSSVLFLIEHFGDIAFTVLCIDVALLKGLFPQHSRVKPIEPDLETSGFSC